VKTNIGRWVLDRGSELLSDLPKAVGWTGGIGKVRNWLEALMLNISQDMPEELTSRMMRSQQETQEWKEQHHPSKGEGGFGSGLKEKEARREKLLKLLSEYDNPMEQVALVNRLKKFVWGDSGAPADPDLDADEILKGIIERYKAKAKAASRIVELMSLAG